MLLKFGSTKSAIEKLVKIIYCILTGISLYLAFWPYSRQITAILSSEMVNLRPVYLLFSTLHHNVVTTAQPRLQSPQPKSLGAHFGTVTGLASS